jgi:hypothetical protein
MLENGLHGRAVRQFQPFPGTSTDVFEKPEEQHLNFHELKAA